MGCAAGWGWGEKQRGRGRPGSPLSVDNHNHRTEKPPPAALGGSAGSGLFDGGSGTPAQQVRHEPHWAADSAPRTQWSSLWSLGSLAVPGSAAAVLAPGFLPTHFCSCPRTGCKVSPGASYPSEGIPTPLLTSSSNLVIGPFTGRAMTGKKKRERKRELGSLLCPEGRAQALARFTKGPSPLCYPSKLPPPKRDAGAGFVPRPWQLPREGVSQRLHLGALALPFGEAAQNGS